MEERSLLATMTWAGGSGANWSTAANWVGGIAPQAGDNLIFPAVAASFVSQNDLVDGIALNTIEISGSGYAISSAPGAHTIQLAGGLTANNTTGANTFGVDITLRNAQTVMNANPSATLNLPGKISTANIIGNYFQGTSAQGSAPALIFDGAGLINTTGEISGAGSISKLGSGTVILGGNNTYEGHTEARQGFIRVTSASGLGSALTGHTDVQAGAAVELSGAITSENFVIREGGVGFGFETDTSSLGALRAVGGTTSAVNNVELVGGNNLMGATINSNLIVNGQVMSSLSNTNRFIKVGPGTVQFAGSQDNVYRGETRVLAGTLELNKSAGKNAIVGDLIIGDNIGGDNAAVVRLLQSDQIADTNFYNVSINTITLNSSGLLDLGAQSDLIGNAVLTTGATYSADIATSTGTLTLGGNITVNNSLGSSGASPAATIGGKLDLGTFFSGGAAGSGQGVTRTFNINDTQHANLATDLNITAVISGDLSITKTGTGTLRLSGANTFTGPFILNSPNNSYSIVEVANNAAFGTGLVSLQQQGNNSIALRAIGGARTIANTLSFDAPGNTANIYFLGDDNLAGVENFTFTGPVTLTSNTVLYVPDPDQTVTFTNSIGEGIFGSLALTKAGRGTLALQGANTYSGNTTINNDGGTLALRGAGSILNTGTITVGIAATLQLDNNAGGNLADRISDAATVTLSGRLQFIGSSTAN
ncbi:MAG TPA: autotransporter-associated beta strand repeat-containing protein, partial [Pirellulaceae bacterium]|nr:autotransporter-associated beta strand repeat-containing protein [Pirellulaceae bacterium]